MIHFNIFNRMFYYKPSIFNYPHFRETSTWSIVFWLIPIYFFLWASTAQPLPLPQLPPALPQSAGCHHPLHGTAGWLDLITFGDQKNLKNRAFQMLHVTQAHFQMEQIP